MLLSINLQGLSKLAFPSVDAGAVIGSIYALAYVIIGAAAIVTWIAMPDETSALVKNLATTFLGLLVPIVAGYFRT
jgi:Ca2+/Na+ antiporter